MLTKSNYPLYLCWLYTSMFYEYDCVMALYKCKQKLGQAWALMNRHTEKENLKIFFEGSSFFFWMFCNQNCSQNYPSLNLREITYPKSSNLTDWCWVIPWPRQEFWDLLRKVLHHENLNSKLKEKISNNTAKPYFWTFSLWH